MIIKKDIIYCICIIQVVEKSIGYENALMTMTCFGSYTPK